MRREVGDVDAAGDEESMDCFRQRMGYTQEVSIGADRVGALD